MKHYNKVLSEQLAELRAEIQHVEIAFRMELGLQFGRGLNPHKLGHVIEQTSRQWRAELARQQSDLRLLNDMAATKRWLKRQKQRLRDMGFDFSPF